MPLVSDPLSHSFDKAKMPRFVGVSCFANILSLGNFPFLAFFNFGSVNKVIVLTTTDWVLNE